VQFPTDDMSMLLIVNQLTYHGAFAAQRSGHDLGTGRSNLAKIARRLEEAGLVTRVSAPGDDRSVLLALTPAGREIGQRILAYPQAFLRPAPPPGPCRARAYTS
jgi:DNA-binding MarR family transcriptional regulator